MSDLIRKSDVLDLLYGIFNKYRMSTDKTHSICNSFGNEVFEEIKNMPTAYDIDKVVKELKKNASRYTKKYVTPYGNNGYRDTKAISIRKAIEIVKQGSVSDDVCEWRLCDEEANVYDTSCRNPHILIEGTPRENKYEFCPYCGKKIKVGGD